MAHNTFSGQYIAKTEERRLRDEREERARNSPFAKYRAEQKRTADLAARVSEDQQMRDLAEAGDPAALAVLGYKSVADMKSKQLGRAIAMCVAGGYTRDETMAFLQKYGFVQKGAPAAAPKKSALNYSEIYASVNRAHNERNASGSIENPSADPVIEGFERVRKELEATHGAPSDTARAESPFSKMAAQYY